MPNEEFEHAIAEKYNDKVNPKTPANWKIRYLDLNKSFNIFPVTRNIQINWPVYLNGYKIKFYVRSF